MYGVYGIVKVEYNSCNKGEYFVHVSHVASLRKGTQRLALCIMAHSI